MKVSRFLQLLANRIFEGKSEPAPSITTDELKSQNDSGVEFFLLDVRTGEEFDDAHLPFTDELIPYDEIDKHLDMLPQNQECLIYCFCRSGRRSGLTTHYLRHLGYTNVFNVEGGILAWAEKGFPLESGDREE